MTQRKQLAFAAAHVEPPLSHAREQARLQLIDHGVSPAKAAELARKLDPLALLDRIEYVAAQVESDRKGSIKNPAGYLIRFAEDEQPIPTTFLTTRQRTAAEMRRGEQEEKRAVENAQSLASMHLENEYARWCAGEADTWIERELPEELLTKRLKGVSSRLRRDAEIASALDRMKPDIRKRELLRALHREVMRELPLPSLAEWTAANPQGVLFAN